MTQGIQPGSPLLTQRSARVVSARKLSRRKYRDERRRFLVEGPQAAREACQAGGAVEEVFVTADALGRYADILREVETVTVVTDQALESLAETVTPQGIVAVCRFVDVALPEVAALVTVLDGISDPGNAGTILRAADATGCDAVVFPDAAVDPYNGKSVRASVGSLFHVPVVRGGKTVDHLAALRKRGMTVLAADAHGDVDLDDMIDASRLTPATAWVFGSEAHGLSDEVKTIVDARVKVPIYGRAESLNLATAATVCLYASARQHRKGASS